MNPSPHRPRLAAAALALAACFTPAALHAADATVFQTSFGGDVLVMPTASSPAPSPGAITPTGTNWYVMSSKDGRASSFSGGFIVTYAATSSAAGVQGVARFTTNPISLAAVGDSITANATVYTNKVQNLSLGLYASGGVDPLSTLANGGLSGTVHTGTVTDGTLAWKGYRARATTNAVAGSIVARSPQTTLTQANFDVAAVNTGDFANPPPTSIGVVADSASPLVFADGFGSEYRLAYTITRSAADALTISYSISDTSNTVLYSISGTTSTAGALPSAVTSAFDAIALGTRNDASAGNSISQLWITNLSVTAKNSDVALITDQPLNQNWVASAAGSISVTATGASPLSYQWYKDSSPLSGATSATYTVPSPSSADNGTYYVVVSNAYGSSTSANATVNFTSASAPSIATQPTNQTVNEGETLTLSASANGAPTPSFQWYKVGVGAISGATQPTYTVAATNAATAGSYYVVATNGQGSPATSDTVTVTINSTAPAIVTEPTPPTLNVGQGIALTVTASGYPAPTYQWYKGAQPSGTLISGAVGASYTVPSATTADAGTYYVVATNLYGSATSADTPVIVNVVPPSITTEPSSTTVTLGQPASFSVVAEGSAPLSYQWYKGAVGSGALIDGATSASYTINPTIGSSAGDYYVVVNNESATPATSAAATLSLVVTESTPVLSTNFAQDTIHAASPVVDATRTNWYVIASKVATNSNVGDDPATTEVVETRPLTLTINAATTSGLYQTATVFAPGQARSLSQIGSSLRATMTFVPRNLSTFGVGLFNSGGVLPHTTHNSGLAAETLLGGTTDITGGVQEWVGYRSAIFASGGTIAHFVNRLPQTNSPTTNRTQDLVVPGTSASYGTPAGTTVGTATNSQATNFAFTSDAEYTLVYEITRSAADSYALAFRLYSGASATGSPVFSTTATTTNAATLPSAVTSSFDSFAFGARTTSNASIPQIVVSSLAIAHSVPVAAIAPAITTQPTDQTVASGATLTLTAAASGSPTPTYQWYRNEDPISGATSATYTVLEASSADAGSYKVVATNAVGSATSNAVVVTVGSASTPYETWSSAQGLTTGVNDGATQDPDGDGVVNLLEFALGGNPLSAASAPLPVVARSGANLTFTYDLETAAAGQFAFTAQSSTDLATWTAVVHGSGGATISTSALDADTNRVVVTLPASSPRLFVRLHVAALP